MTEHILWMAALLLGSAFFSATEIAVTMASRVRLRTRAEQGRRGAGHAERLLLHPERAIVSCLVGGNLVNIAIATYGRAVVMDAHPFPDAVADLLATLVVVPLVLVLGETLPKALAQTYPNRTLAALASPLGVLRLALWPLVQVSFGVAGLVRRAAGLQSGLLDFLSREELKQFVAHSEKSGHVDSDERDLIYQIFEFWKLDPSRFVRRLADVPHLPADAPAGRAKELMRELRLGRLAVTNASGSEVVGVASAVLLLDAPNDAPLGSLTREPVRAPLAQGVDRLLTELQKSPSQMAVVRGPEGELAGILLLDDLLPLLLGRAGQAARPAADRRDPNAAGSRSQGGEERP